MRPEVTVVITTLDRRDYLREAVASVRAQAAVIHELIVVDNGSADGTGDWLAAQDDLLALHAGRDQTLTRSSNISVARNAGLARANGAYVWFLDDDDRLRPGALATLARALDEHPAAVAAVGARTRFGDGVVGGRIAHPLRRVVGDLGPELLLSWGWIPSQALCRAATLRQVGGWREDVPHSEDLDMWARIGSLGPVVLEPATVVEYRVHRAQSRLRDPAALRDLLLRPHQSALAGGDAARGRALLGSRKRRLRHRRPPQRASPHPACRGARAAATALARCRPACDADDRPLGAAQLGACAPLAAVAAGAPAGGAPPSRHRIPQLEKHARRAAMQRCASHGSLAARPAAARRPPS